MFSFKFWGCEYFFALLFCLLKWHTCVCFCYARPWKSADFHSSVLGKSKKYSFFSQNAFEIKNRQNTFMICYKKATNNWMVTKIYIKKAVYERIFPMLQTFNMIHWNTSNYICNFENIRISVYSSLINLNFLCN